jgi:hypothetical protein
MAGKSKLGTGQTSIEKIHTAQTESKSGIEPNTTKTEWTIVEENIESGSQASIVGNQREVAQREVGVIVKE